MDLSILIPARCEMFLKCTVEDILEHIEADTEIIVVLDGAWAVPSVEDHKRVTMVYHPVSVGQRAATNEAAQLARGQYVMKCDAHCSFGQGFDRILLEDIQPDWTMVPLMKNLHVFDWVCTKCGHRRYQGPIKPCEKCGSEMERDILWKAKKSPNTTSMRFDRNLKFQYWGGYKKRQKGDLVDTMSVLGACWMLSRERYFALNICDELFGSWGQQGTEVACKTWLSGGRLVCSKKTWFAHLFRTQGADFGFPYPLSGRAVQKARQYSKLQFLEGNWERAIHPLSWLIDKFAPVPDWGAQETSNVSLETWETEKLKDPEFKAAVAALDDTYEANRQQILHKIAQQGPTKAIVYYTDNRLSPTIMAACQRQLKKAGLPIVSVSLQPLDFGQNIVLDLERGPLTMFKQILAGIEASDADVLYFCEHDCLYNPSHFDFTPERDNLFYYNNNVWKVDAETGRALFHYSNHTSQLCARRSLLLEHYRKRVAMVERDGFSRRMGYEPGTHNRKERVDDYGYETWMSERPNIDLRHGQNLTRTRWNKSEFRNRKFTKGWTEAESVPGWGCTAGQMAELLSEAG